MQEIVLGKTLSLEHITQIAHGLAAVKLDADIKNKLDSMRAQIEAMAKGSKPYYGINTGFGALAETSIAPDQQMQLQHNLILSHAVGVGQPMLPEQARALMLLRAHTLALGHSGVSSPIVSNLIRLLNAGVAPCVPAKGSVGASGDLAPLAHVALLLLGHGKAFIGRELTTAAGALRHASIEPSVLGAKEGLALINGTQAMAALGTLAVLNAQKLCQLADMIGACSLDALKGSDTPFDPRIHQLRPHPGQSASAQMVRNMLQGSEIRESHRNCGKVQDPYSLRCMPQVHGASRDATAHVRQILEREINSVTDNPLVFEANNELEILSGGNFHGQYLALALDYLAMAVAELANISERRVELMLNPNYSCGLPAFLAAHPGLNSGYMILQVTTAALINENKVLCHPASTDSIPTSANREDHVSMGMTSANKVSQVIENVYHVLAIELLAACQALDFRAPLKGGVGVQRVFETVRKEIAHAKEDRWFGPDIEQAVNLCKTKLAEII